MRKLQLWQCSLCVPTSFEVTCENRGVIIHVGRWNPLMTLLDHFNYWEEKEGRCFWTSEQARKGYRKHKLFHSVRFGGTITGGLSSGLSPFKTKWINYGFKESDRIRKCNRMKQVGCYRRVVLKVVGIYFNLIFHFVLNYNFIFYSFFICLSFYTTLSFAIPFTFSVSNWMLVFTFCLFNLFADMCNCFVYYFTLVQVSFPKRIVKLNYFIVCKIKIL